MLLISLDGADLIPFPESEIEEDATEVRDTCEDLPVVLVFAGLFGLFGLRCSGEETPGGQNDCLEDPVPLGSDELTME
jgi:hypothetical protein